MKTKTKKITAIVLAIIGGIVVLGGIATGIFFGVKTVPCEGYVLDKATDLPIANVSVTNGKYVVKTDDKGFFKLKGWYKAEFVTVTNPSGYWTDNYYLSINSKTDKYNFKLDKLNRDDSEHTFIQVSDTEIGAAGVGEDWINNIKQVVKETSPAFIIHTGDICYEDGLNAHIKGMNSENMGVPVRYVIGNHDYVKGAYGEALFEKNYGPVCYSFDVGDVHYMVTPYGLGADMLPRYSGTDVGRWVENDLKTVSSDKKVVMFNHNYANDESGYNVSYGTKKVNFREHNLLAWVFGHWHYNFINESNGVLNISTGKPDTGGIDSTTNAIRTVTIKDKKIDNSRLHYIYSTENVNTDFAWRQKVAGRAQFSEPLMIGNTVYVATMSDEYPAKCDITALDATRGVILWDYKTKNSIRNSIAYQDGKLVAQDCEGVVYCVDAATGNEVWTKDTELEDPRNSGKNVLIDGDKVYCGNAEKITCLNFADGEFKWQTKHNGNSSSPTRMVIQDKYLLVGSHWDRLLVFDKVSGKKLWNSDNWVKHNKAAIFLTATPIIYNNKVIIPYDSYLYEMNLSDGGNSKLHEFKDYNFDTASTPLVIGNIAYITTVYNGVVAINLDTYEMLWSRETRDSLVYTSPYSRGAKTVDGSIIERDGKLYYGALDGYIYCVDKSNGKIISEYNLGAPIMNKLLFSGDALIVSDFEGRVTKINLSSLVPPTAK